MDSPVTPRMPAGLSARALAPDLARGAMLLAIALAHAPVFISDWDLGPAALNTAAEFFKHLVADNQARAMFVFLFGYGLGQLARRQFERGGDWMSLRRLLRRRGFWLVVIGFAHGALLVPMDIIAVYGLTLVVVAPLVRASDAVLLWTAALALVPATMLIAWQAMTARAAAAAGTPVTLVQTMAADPGTHIVTNIGWWPVEAPVSAVVVVPGMLLGIWAARRRILDEPQRHRPLLRRVAVLLIGASVAGRLPAALLLSGAWTTTSTPLAWALTLTHTLAGYGGGIGMAAAIGVLALRAGPRPGWFTTALAALGQRSMTFYLAQSAVFLALFYPFTLDLRADMGIAAAYGVAVGIWAASVLLAAWMHRAGHRGPAEVLLRRLSAGSTAPLLSRR